MQGGWIYRAIKMCIRLFQWEKAYDLARTHQQHVDTVLLYRHKYLVAHGAEDSVHVQRDLVGQVHEHVGAAAELVRKVVADRHDVHLLDVVVADGAELLLVRVARDAHPAA